MEYIGVHTKVRFTTGIIRLILPVSKETLNYFHLFHTLFLDSVKCVEGELKAPISLFSFASYKK